jgi:toluene monooxygenase system ferredoxin subunit
MTAHRLMAVSELWNGDLVGVDRGRAKILVVKIDDQVHAYANRCAHLGMPLSEGSLDGRVLTCASHHWQYDATTGRGVNPETACLERYPVSIQDGHVVVEVPDD